ncbi:MAG TPA: PDZ domain-containing protein [Gemmatimonadales bacterium]|nr:PDZ domain-containing protein [Gemmatimonadales bacterium]
MRAPWSALAMAGAFCIVPLSLTAQIDARLLRQPDVSATQIAFVYAGDIWVAPKAGGVAVRLSSPRGEESFPRFSPDGKEIAFTGDYDGNQDIYVTSAGGGVPRRITHHPAPDRMLDWYPDGQSILFASGMESGRDRFNQLYRVSKTGGLPVKLPVPYGEFAAVSEDGQWLAYMPQSQDFRTWKRYRGGWASHIWLYNLRTGAAKTISTTDANDAQPMWHGHTLYFLSDRGAAMRANIWAYQIDSGTARQVTTFTDYDIHFPAIGPTDLVFEQAGKLWLLDLATEKAHDVAIQVVTDEATLKPQLDSVGGMIHGAWISPSGKRVVFEARGDVFTVPAEHGPVLDLTRTSGTAERFPSWSPDGKTLAYWSDRSGEYELVLRPADGSGAEEQVTSLGKGFRYIPFWSPDSRKLAFVDQTMTIWIFDRDTKKTVRVDKALSFYEGALESFRPSWSGDSRWLAYARDLENIHTAVFLFDTKAGTTRQVTSGFYNDAQPAFDPDGKYLYYASDRTFQPIYSDVDNTWIYPNSTRIMAVALRADVPSPLAARDDEEGAAADSGSKGAGAAKPGAAARDTAAKGPAPVVIELDGFEQRAVALPPAAGNYADLQAVSGKVVYRRPPRTGSSDQKTPLMAYDLKDRKEQTIIDDANAALVSADGKKVLIQQARRWAILDLKPDQKIETPLRTAELVMTVDPPAEWKQIFADVWRFERDYFYDPNMHGVDWNAMRTQYGRLLDGAVTRWDVNFVIGELIAELNSSHTYRGGGDLEPEPRRGVGLLGVDWSLENGAYRIKRVIDGAPWDGEVRSPLAAPGVNVKAGDYVLAVNGVPLDTAQDPWAAFDGLAGKDVRLTVNSRPSREGARDVVVTTLENEGRLRYLAWVEANRRRVDEATQGKVGYVYVPSTGIDGQTELARQYLAQVGKQGLIVDERWNSGGQIPDRFIELLDRPALAYYAVRDGQDWQWPRNALIGPKVMLINGWSGSGGDAFPTFFREAKLGPLIGTRTWGGIIGISGVPTLIDDGNVTVPTFRQYDPQGKWFAEGHGVDPDIEVVDDQAQLAKGVDPQLERAIQEVTKAVQAAQPLAPKRPAYEKRVAGGN